MLGFAGLGLATVALGGCGVDWRAVRLDTAGSPTPPTFTDDDLARFAAVQQVTVLLLQARQLGSDAGTSVAHAHEAQLGALGELPGPVPSASVTPTNWPSATPTTAPALDAAGLAQAEQGTALAVLPDLTKLSGPAARLLTSLAASLLAASELLDPDLAPAQGLPQPPTDLGALPPDSTRDPLQAVADTEDAAGFAYASLAAALTGSERDLAVSLLSDHRERSMQVRSLATASGLELTPPPPAYDVPAVADPQAAKAACAALEHTCAAAASDLFNGGHVTLTQLGQALLIPAGRAQARWGSLPALPGIS